VLSDIIGALLPVCTERPHLDPIATCQGERRKDKTDRTPKGKAMHRRFIALIVGTALVVTSFTATPSRAQSLSETAAIISGVAALVIVGAALTDDRKQDRHRNQVAHNYGYGSNHYEHAPKQYRKSKRYHDRDDHKHDHRKNYRKNRYDDRGYRPYRSYENGYRSNERGYRNRYDERGYNYGHSK